MKPKIVHYLETPPSAKELTAVLAAQKKSPREIMRRGEEIYKALGLDDPKLADVALIKAMTENPILIERSIVINGRKAALGRPPEAVLEIV